MVYFRVLDWFGVNHSVEIADLRQQRNKYNLQKLGRNHNIYCPKLDSGKSVWLLIIVWIRKSDVWFCTLVESAELFENTFKSTFKLLIFQRLEKYL